MNSHRDNRTVSGWAERSLSPAGQSLEAELTLPERQLGLRHSWERSRRGYTRAARLSLSPEAFVGYQLSVTGQTEPVRRGRARERERERERKLV